MTVDQMPGLLAWWDFQDGLTSRGPRPITLVPHGEVVPVADGGPFGSRALRFSERDRLAAGHLSTDDPALAIGGPEATVTVVAWLRREPSSYGGCQFVAGVWNEHRGRQYGLFLNLGIWQSREAVGAHVSAHGGATPGFPYCMDVALGGSEVSFDRWHTVALGYDGVEATAWLDGVLDRREPAGAMGRNPFRMPGGLHRGSAPFTVGAVTRPDRVRPDGAGGFVEEGSSVANPFVGLLGGIAVFDRAVTAEEHRSLHDVLRSTPESVTRAG